MLASDSPREGRRPQSISTGAVIVTAAAGVFVASGYIVNVWLGRLLGPDDYGRFGVVIGLLTVLNVIQNAAVPQAVARAAAQAPESADATLRRGAELQLSLALLMALSLALGAPLIASVFGDPNLSSLLGVAALVLPAYGLFTLLMAFHSGRRHYTRQALTQAAYAAAKVVGAIGLAYAFRLAGALAGYVIAPIVGVLVGWHTLTAGRSTVPYRSLIRFAGPLSIYAIATVGQMSLDIFFVKAMISSPDVAGYYAASQNIARIPYYLMTGLAAIILPAIAAAAQRGPGAAAGTAAQALRWATIIVVPIAALILTTNRPLVELLYSARYSPAAEVLVVLVPAMGALALSSIAAGVLSGLGRPGASAVLAVVGLAVTLVACIVLTPLAGSRGAATATLAGSVVTLLGIAFVLWRVAPGSLPIMSLLRVTASSAVVAVAAWVVAAEGFGLLIAYVGLAALGAVLLVGSRELTIGEIRSLWHRVRP